jgi:hypothetical protein
MTNTHGIERTSPKGGKFIGTCMKCGTPGLTIADMGKPCENLAGMSDEEALITAIDGLRPESGD